MKNNKLFNAGGSPSGPDFRTPGIPPNVNTNLPDKSFTSATFLDVPYATQSDAQKLDLYLPSSGKKPYPVIVSIHGGGWLVGDKRWNIAEFGETMLAKGYAVVSINHRPTSEAIFPAQIYDAKAAIRWIRANAAKYNLNPNKIIAWGGSSGGHLAALLGTSGHVKELEDLSMGNPDQSSRVDAVVDLSGPIDFLQLDAQIEKLGLKTAFGVHDVEYGPESKLVGGQISKVPEKCRAANPMTYIRADNPPFYIRHGKVDPAVPYLQSVNLANALRAAIGEDKVRLEITEGGTEHGSPAAGHGSPTGLPENMDRLLEFLEKQLI